MYYIFVVAHTTALFLNTDRWLKKCFEFNNMFGAKAKLPNVSYYYELQPRKILNISSC